MNKKNMESINNWENLLRAAEIELKTIKLLRGKKWELGDKNKETELLLSSFQKW